MTINRACVKFLCLCSGCGGLVLHSLQMDEGPEAAWHQALAGPTLKCRMNNQWNGFKVASDTSGLLRVRSGAPQKGSRCITAEYSSIPAFGNVIVQMPEGRRPCNQSRTFTGCAGTTQ